MGFGLTSAVCGGMSMCLCARDVSARVGVCVFSMFMLRPTAAMDSV